MTLEELVILEARIAELREQREEHNRVRIKAKEEALALSNEILELEALLPPAKQRNKMRGKAVGTEARMPLEPAKVNIAPKNM